MATTTAQTQAAEAAEAQAALEQQLAELKANEVRLLQDFLQGIAACRTAAAQLRLYLTCLLRCCEWH